MEELEIISHQRYNMSKIEKIIDNIINEYRHPKHPITNFDEFKDIKKRLKWKVFKDEVLPIFHIAKILNMQILEFQLLMSMIFLMMGM